MGKTLILHKKPAPPSKSAFRFGGRRGIGVLLNDKTDCCTVENDLGGLILVFLNV